MNLHRLLLAFGLFATTLSVPHGALAQSAPDDATKVLVSLPAVMHRHPTSGALLAATMAGQRIVAAGAQGVVVFSDDEGRHFRQAQVPVRLQLNGLHFADERTGWAVGHGGAILRTDDGGQTWQIQRTGLQADQPLFSVWFRDKNQGWAVGLWSQMLHTEDGGKTWQRVDLPPPDGQKRADLNLFRVFGDGADGIFVACERGQVLRSLDGGRTWAFQATGYDGSLWSGVAWPDGVVVAAGLRGTILRSTDSGRSWAPVALAVKSSVTSLARHGAIVSGVGTDGLMLSSTDQGRSFSAVQRQDRLPLTALAALPSGAWFTVSQTGVPTQASWAPAKAP